MTKEEILKKYYPSLIYQEDEFGLTSIYEAMEEYAQQQVKNCSIPHVSKSFYCQSDIEMDGLCNEQCEHCKEYYKPLEQ